MSPPEAPPLLNPRTLAHVALAWTLVLVGCFRYASDLWCDADPEYWRRFDDSWLRYLIRAPSDGTLLGDLNVQGFKLLSVPCAMSLVYLWFRRRYRTLTEARYRFGQRWVRVLWVATFFTAFTLIEVEKQWHLFGTRTAGQLTGEGFWLNQVVHVVSALIAYAYVSSLSFEPLFGREAPRDVLRSLVPRRREPRATAPPPAEPPPAPPTTPTPEAPTGPPAA